jgi:hypothetical protein
MLRRVTAPSKRDAANILQRLFGRTAIGMKDHVLAQVEVPVGLHIYLDGASLAGYLLQNKLRRQWDAFFKGFAATGAVNGYR